MSLAPALLTGRNVIFNDLGSAEKICWQNPASFYFRQIWEMGSKGIYVKEATDLVPPLTMLPQKLPGSIPVLNSKVMASILVTDIPVSISH